MLEPQWNRWEGERVRVWLGNDDACHPTGSNGVISRCRCSSCRRPQLLLLLITFFLEDFNWSFLFLPLSSLSFFISFINDITQLYLLSCSVCVLIYLLYLIYLFTCLFCVFFFKFFLLKFIFRSRRLFFGCSVFRVSPFYFSLLILRKRQTKTTMNNFHYFFKQ